MSGTEFTMDESTKDGSTKDESTKISAQVEQEDWFSRGRADALMGYSKQPPEVDPEAASQYDLGYGEGSIQHSLAQTTAGTDL